MSECLFSSGFDGVVEDAEHCVTLANEIGYPVMIKVLNNNLSSLGSLFIPHRFFLFHTPIIALGKVFSPPTQAKI